VVEVVAIQGVIVVAVEEEGEGIEVCLLDHSVRARESYFTILPCAPITSNDN